MFLSRILAVAAAVSFVLFNAGCDETTTPGTEIETGPLTINVISHDRFALPIANTPVSVNAADGSIIAHGVTDASGAFTVPSVEAGVSASVANADSVNTGPLLQTKFGLKPNQTYTFTMSKPEPIVGTITVNVTNLPGAGLFASLSVGGCYGSSGSPITLTKNCVQSDGRITIHGIAMESDRTIRGQALKTDLTFTNGMTVSLDDWTIPQGSVTGALVNVPGKFLDGSMSLLVERFGASFNIETNYNNTTTSETGIAGINMYPPSAFLTGASGLMYRTFGMGTYDQDGTLRYAGFAARSHWLPSPYQVDLSQILPGVEITSVHPDFSGDRPGMIWSVTGGESADAALGILVWKTGDRDNYWLTMAPIGDGFMQAPELPASMSDFAPPSAGWVNGPILFVVGSSRAANYDEFAKVESGIGAVQGTVVGGNGAEDVTVRLVGAMSTTVLRKKIPGQDSSAPMTGLAISSPILREMYKR